MSVSELKFYSWSREQQRYIFCGAGIIHDLEYENDYLNPTEQTVKVKDFSLINPINYHDVMVFELLGKPQLCIVKAFSIDENKTASVTFAPFVAYYNVDEQIIIPENMSYINSNWGQNLFSVISQILTYKSGEMGFGADDYTNKINAFTDGSSMEWWYLADSLVIDSEAAKYKAGNVLNDILIPAYERYGIYVDFSFIESPFTINAEVRQLSLNPFSKIETCLPEIIEKQLNIQKSGDYNVLYIMGIDYYSNKQCKWSVFKRYHKLNNKWIIAEGGLFRYVPVKAKTVIIEHDSGEALSPDTNAILQLILDYIAEANANYSESANMSIEFKNSSKHLEFKKFKLFDKIEIYHNGEVYTAVLTAIKYTQSTTLLTFGTARLELTKKLRRQYAIKIRDYEAKRHKN